MKPLNSRAVEAGHGHLVGGRLAHFAFWLASILGGSKSTVGGRAIVSRRASPAKAGSTGGRRSAWTMAEEESMDVDKTDDKSGPRFVMKKWRVRPWHGRSLLERHGCPSARKSDLPGPVI
jgi:hypothetical protein